MQELKRRSRAKVIYDILKVASRSARKTTMMYKANLNFCRFNRYFNELIEEEFIAISRNPHTLYYLTEKGLQLLKAMEETEKLISL
jgi:predicted transcriptional regulator